MRDSDGKIPPNFDQLIPHIVTVLGMSPVEAEGADGPQLIRWNKIANAEVERRNVIARRRNRRRRG